MRKVTRISKEDGSHSTVSLDTAMSKIIMAHDHITEQEIIEGLNTGMDFETCLFIYCGLAHPAEKKWGAK